MEDRVRFDFSPSFDIKGLPGRYLFQRSWSWHEGMGIKDLYEGCFRGPVP